MTNIHRIRLSSDLQYVSPLPIIYNHVNQLFYNGSVIFITTVSDASFYFFMSIDVVILSY